MICHLFLLKIFDIRKKELCGPIGSDPITAQNCLHPPPPTYPLIPHKHQIFLIDHLLKTPSHNISRLKFSGHSKINNKSSHRF